MDDIFTKRIAKGKLLYLMLFPSFIFMFVFSYLPLLGWAVAFKDYNIGKGFFECRWVGLQKFKEFLFESNDYMYTLRNTLVMNIVGILAVTVLSMILAILLNEVGNRSIKKILQTVTFFPFFVSWVVVYALLYALFASSSGAINNTLVSLGIIKEGINLLGGMEYSWTLVIISGLWKYGGYYSVIYLASLAGIPSEQYESALIDGAGRWDKIRWITIPNLLPTLSVLLIMNSGWVLNSNLEQYFIFTNGTNWETMEVMDMYIYRYGLKLLNYSYATAVGIIKTIVSLTILIGVNRVSKYINGKSIF